MTGYQFLQDYLCRHHVNQLRGNRAALDYLAVSDSLYNELKVDPAFRQLQGLFGRTIVIGSLSREWIVNAVRFQEQQEPEVQDVVFD